MKPKRTGKRPTLLRWTIEAASREFGVDRKTLTKQLTQEGATPAQDGRFSTRQILDAIYSGEKIEELLMRRAKRQMAEDERDERRARLLDAEEVGTAWAEVVTTVVQRLDGLKSKVESRYRVGMPVGELAGMVEEEIDEAKRDMSKAPNIKRRKTKKAQ